MSKAKKTAGEPAPAKGRSLVYNVRLTHELDAAVNDYIAAQEVTPDRSAVVLVAVRKFLEERGFYPPRTGEAKA